jgi:hypothetical protein
MSPPITRETIAARTVVWIYTALAAAAIFVAAFIVAERVPALSSPISDYGALYGLLFLFVAVPFGVVVAWAVGRRRTPEPARRYARRLRWLLVPAWLVSAAPVAFFALLIEPWPLSLRQGPDTEFARGCLARHFGGEALPVSGVYCRVDSGWGDRSTFLRFAFSDPFLPSRLVARRQLVSPAEGTTGLRGYIGGGPGWWDGARIGELTEIYVRRQGGVLTLILWVDRASATVYYRDLWS